MNPLRCPALSAAVNRLANRRPQRRPLLAASATGGARRRCLENGRQLAGFSKGPISADYEYDINGTRTKKTFNTVAGSVTTEYYYNNGMFLGFYRSIKKIVLMPSREKT